MVKIVVILTTKENSAGPPASPDAFPWKRKFKEGVQNCLLPLQMHSPENENLKEGFRREWFGVESRLLQQCVSRSRVGNNVKIERDATDLFVPACWQGKMPFKNEFCLSKMECRWMHQISPSLRKYYGLMAGRSWLLCVTNWLLLLLLPLFGRL